MNFYQQPLPKAPNFRKLTTNTRNKSSRKRKQNYRIQLNQLQCSFPVYLTETEHSNHS